MTGIGFWKRNPTVWLALDLQWLASDLFWRRLTKRPAPNWDGPEFLETLENLSLIS